MWFRWSAGWLVVAGTLGLAAADWPEFRGPTGQGLVPAGRLPVEWGPEKNIAWKQSIPGKGWSSPILVGGRIFLTTAVPSTDDKNADQSLRALCLDAATGRVLWNTEVFKQDGDGSPSIHSKNSHASPTPISDGKKLWVHFGHEGTACLDLNGKVLWRNQSNRYQPVHGNGGSPILAGQALIFSIDGSDRQCVLALDRDTGKELWRLDRESDAAKKFSFGTPLLISVNGKQQVISTGSDVVQACDPRTGKELWRVRYFGYSVVPRPVFAHGLLIIATGYDSPQVLAIRPDGKGDVTETHIAWRLKAGAPNNPSPLIVGDELYLVSDAGVASCVDVRTGEVRWKERLGGNFSASPIHAGGHIYFLDEEGTTTVLKRGPHFERVARNRLEERTLASPAAGDGALFIRTESHLYRIQASP